MRRVPTEQQIEHAKRKIILFIQSKLKEEEECLKMDEKPSTHLWSKSLQINEFPNELWERNIIHHFSGLDLLNYSSTCKMAYLITLESSLWTKILNQKLKSLDMPELHLRSLNYGKIIYRRVKPYIKLLRDAFRILRDIKTVPDNIQKVQNIFKELRLDSPWTPNPKERFRTDLQKFTYPDEINIKIVSQTFAMIQIQPKTGFYKDESLDFIIHAGNYPFGPPIVHIQSSIYHPMLRSCGRVDNPLSFVSNWKIHYHTVSDVILEVLHIFLDPKILTNYFIL
jgi:ubiquitin-protein ligase